MYIYINVICPNFENLETQKHRVSSSIHRFWFILARSFFGKTFLQLIYTYDPFFQKVLL